MMETMTGDNAQDEPTEQHQVGSGDDEPSEAHEEDVAEKQATRRLAAAFGSGEVSGELQDQFAASIARNLAPQLQTILTKQLQPVVDAFRVQPGVSFTQSVAPRLDQIFGSQLEVFRDRVRWLAPQLTGLPPLKVLTDLLPPNWKEVPDLDIETIVAIVLNEGIPLVWVPRAAIVTALVGVADADARDAILIRSRDEIAHDCLAVIGEVADTNLKPLAGLAAEAVAALQAGHSSSAQALAGNVFDTLLRDMTRRGVIFNTPQGGYFKYAKVRNQITPVSDETVLRQFRPACVLSAALPALQDFDPSDPPPARFVRHATAHGARPEQYTEVNAIIAAMLMASTLREAEASGW